MAQPYGSGLRSRRASKRPLRVEAVSFHTVQRQRLPKLGGKFLGRLDTQLLVDVHASKYHLDGRRRDAEFAGQKAHHVIGSPASAGCSGNADFELMAFGLADGIAIGARLAQYVDHERIAFPPEKRLGRR